MCTWIYQGRAYLREACVPPSPGIPMAIPRQSIWYPSRPCSTMRLENIGIEQSNGQNNGVDADPQGHILVFEGATLDDTCTRGAHRLH